MSRRKGRRERRQAAREERRKARSDAVGGLEDVFTFHALYKYGKMCCTGVRWKNSTQRFELHLFSGTAKRRREVLEGRYKWKGYTRFHVNERGKDRTIDAPHIHDRQIQKVLTKEVLLPLYLPSMIWDNGASLPGKGLGFSRRQLMADLCHHYRLYGPEGSIILADCQRFFPTAPHWAIRERHRELIYDTDLRALVDSILDTIPGDYGVPLGVEPSQMEMVALPSPLDNFARCQMGVAAGHYMDDYHIVVPPGTDPRKVLERFTEKARETGLTISKKKTRILPFGRPFRFCKAKYVLDPATGGYTVHGSRESAQRARRKIRRFQALMDEGRMTYPDLWDAIQGVFNYYGSYNDHGRVLHLRRLLFALFGVNGERREDFLEAEMRRTLCAISATSDTRGLEPSSR